MQRLTAYVRRTILASAKEYAYPRKRRTEESTKAAFIDAMRGTNTGWWSGLIYTAPMLQMAHRYRADILAAIMDFMGETGAEAWQNVRVGSDITYADMIAATALKRTFDDYHGASAARAKQAEAKLLGLSFAVEYIAGNLAREYCPDL